MTGSDGFLSGKTSQMPCAARDLATGVAANNVAAQHN